jgi:6-phosphogluconolactonase
MSAHRRTYPDAGAAAEACGAHILALLETALSGEGEATLALSGGMTPKPMFEYMARTRFDWSHVQIFWVDERAVPPNHEQSNYRFLDEHLLGPGRVPHRNVHRIYSELPPSQAAKRYEAELIESFEISEDDLPHFDVIHLGIGADAHTASLFPTEPLIDDREKLVAAVYVRKIPQWRITLLPGVLLASRHVAVLVAGEDKGPALQHVFHGAYSPREFPAQIIAHHARHATWFLDAGASKGLD